MDPPLSRIAAIVHDLDLKDGKFGAPECGTVGALIEGLQLAYQNDDALLEQGMTLFDSLYRSFEQSSRSTGPRPLPGRSTRNRRAEAEARQERAVKGSVSSRVAAVRSDELNDGEAPGLSPAAARAALVRLCAAGFVAYCSYSICRAPLLPLFARELGAGPSLIGFVMGASTLTGVFLKLPAGALSDLFGRQRLLVAGALVFATLPFTYLAVSTLAWLVVLRFLHGSATAIFGPVASASLSDIAPAARRGAWLSTYSTAQGTGQAIGPVVAGYLIAAGRFDLAFIVSGLIGLGVPLIVGTWRGVPAGTSPRPSWRRIQARRHGGRERSTGAHHQRRPCRAVRAQRHAQRLSAALRARGPEPFWIRARLAVRHADRHHTDGAARHRCAVGSRRTAGGDCDAA